MLFVIFFLLVEFGLTAHSMNDTPFYFVVSFLKKRKKKIQIFSKVFWRKRRSVLVSRAYTPLSSLYTLTEAVKSFSSRPADKEEEEKLWFLTFLAQKVFPFSNSITHIQNVHTWLEVSLPFLFKKGKPIGLIGETLYQVPVGCPFKDACPVIETDVRVTNHVKRRDNIYSHIRLP